MTWENEKWYSQHNKLNGIFGKVDFRLLDNIKEEK